MNGGSVPPPPKRQRLSPLPQSQSPYASPNSSFSPLQLPPQSSQAMNGATVDGLANSAASPQPQIPLPPPPPGVMGPPSRPPAEKAIDAAELTDVLASAGVDVKEEEAFLTSGYSTSGVQPQVLIRAQQPPAANISFASQASSGGTVSAVTSFAECSPLKTSNAQESFYEFPFQERAPFKNINESTREDTQAARRAQYHLQEPFLLTKVLEQRLQRRGFELGVRIPSEGLFNPVPGKSQPIEVTGPDGSSVVRTGHAILNQDGAPLVDILNLMSISCEERLRTVIDYSSTLARSRRAHSHGIVPTEWKDLAISTNIVVVDEIDPTKVPPKQLPLADSVSVNSGILEKCRMLMEKDVFVEDKRKTRRSKRSANAILAEGGADRADLMDRSGSGGSTPISERAPSIGKGLSKKEAKKLLDAKISEAQQHQQSVETARLATNSMLNTSRFGAKKSYSWLNRGTTTPSGFSTPTNRVATPATGGDKIGRKSDGVIMTTKRLGSWREDREKGRDIQVRDILFMLELDGRGSRHVQKAYSKDVKEDRLD